jgi:hypothetical protein
MNCQKNVNSIPPTQLPHKFLYIVARFIHNYFESPNIYISISIARSMFKTGIVPQNLKILDLENTLVVEIQKGILLYSCHIVRKFLNIDTEHKTQKSQNVEARRR